LTIELFDFKKNKYAGKICWKSSLLGKDGVGMECVNVFCLGMECVNVFCLGNHNVLSMLGKETH
jgi:hypothetical protein